METLIFYLLIMLFIVVISNGLNFPSRDELVLFLSSCGFLILTWLYKKENLNDNKQKELD